MPAAYTPSETAVVSALKEALNIGAQSASDALSAQGGYYLNDAYKILLPPEAATIIKNISTVPGGDKLVEDVILRVNTAAESAAADVVPIFASAIKGMTLRDGMGILLGEKDAATQYFRKTAGEEIKKAYQPKLQAALREPMIAGISADNSWRTLTTQYNKVAGSAAGKLAGMTAVNTSMDDYVLNRAVDGLFARIAQEEAQIRQQPLAYGSELVKKVFSYAKKN